MSTISIIGAGGHGKVVAEIAEQNGFVVEFLDDTYPSRTIVSKWSIVGIPKLLESTMFCAVGNNKIRQKLFEQYCQTSALLTHPKSIISPSACLLEGTVAIAGSIVNSDTKIGRGVILNTGCSVDHDCEIGDFTHISPGAHLAGGVSVGARAWIGIGAIVREGIKIGADAIVAAGAVVVSDVEAGQVVLGIPAKGIKSC